MQTKTPPKTSQPASKPSLKTRIKRGVFLLCGGLSLLLGIIGVYTPVLPTTPFVLLAAFCFSKSSPRFHAYLLNHPRFGKSIQAWQERRAIPAFAKRLSWVTMSASCAFLFWSFDPKYYPVAAAISLVCLATGVWMARLPDA